MIFKCKTEKTEFLFNIYTDNLDQKETKKLQKFNSTLYLHLRFFQKIIKNDKIVINNTVEVKKKDTYQCLIDFTNYLIESNMILIQMR